MKKKSISKEFYLLFKILKNPIFQNSPENEIFLIIAFEYDMIAAVIDLIAVIEIKFLKNN